MIFHLFHPLITSVNRTDFSLLLKNSTHYLDHSRLYIGKETALSETFQNVQLSTKNYILKHLPSNIKLFELKKGETKSESSSGYQDKSLGWIDKTKKNTTDASKSSDCQRVSKGKVNYTSCKRCYPKVNLTIYKAPSAAKLWFYHIFGLAARKPKRKGVCNQFVNCQESNKMPCSVSSQHLVVPTISKKISFRCHIALNGKLPEIKHKKITGLCKMCVQKSDKSKEHGGIAAELLRAITYTSNTDQKKQSGAETFVCEACQFDLINNHILLAVDGLRDIVDKHQKRKELSGTRAKVEEEYSRLQKNKSLDTDFTPPLGKKKLNEVEVNKNIPSEHQSSHDTNLGSPITKDRVVNDFESGKSTYLKEKKITVNENVLAEQEIGSHKHAMQHDKSSKQTENNEVDETEKPSSAFETIKKLCGFCEPTKKPVPSKDGSSALPKEEQSVLEETAPEERVKEATTSTKQYTVVTDPNTQRTGEATVSKEHPHPLITKISKRYPDRYLLDKDIEKILQSQKMSERNTVGFKYRDHCKRKPGEEIIDD